MLNSDKLKVYTRRLAKRSLMRFLENEKYGGKPMSVNWIIGELRTSGIQGEELKKIFDELKNYPENMKEKKLFEVARKTAIESGLM